MSVLEPHVDSSERKKCYSKRKEKKITVTVRSDGSRARSYV